MRGNGSIILSRDKHFPCLNNMYICILSHKTLSFKVFHLDVCPWKSSVHCNLRGQYHLSNPFSSDSLWKKEIFQLCVERKHSWHYSESCNCFDQWIKILNQNFYVFFQMEYAISGIVVFFSFVIKQCLFSLLFSWTFFPSTFDWL